MLLNQHHLRAEIARRSTELAFERGALIDEIGTLRCRLKQRATSPLTLGLLFLAGLGVGLITRNKLLPKGMGWMLWHSGSPLFLSALSQWMHRFVGGDDEFEYEDDADAMDE